MTRPGSVLQQNERYFEVASFFFSLLVSRLKNSLQQGGCEIQMDDKKGIIKVNGSQQQIQELQDRIQLIVGGFGERSLTQTKFSMLKTDDGLSYAKSLLLTEKSTVEISVNDRGSVMLYGLDETKVQHACTILENAICEYKLPESKSSGSFLLVPILLHTHKVLSTFSKLG